MTLTVIVVVGLWAIWWFASRHERAEQKIEELERRLQEVKSMQESDKNKREPTVEERVRKAAASVLLERPMASWIALFVKKHPGATTNEIEAAAKRFEDLLEPNPQYSAEMVKDLLGRLASCEVLHHDEGSEDNDAWWSSDPVA